MEWVQALVLALIQGLTEFLPISSSAHLILPAQVLGWPDQGLAFDVAVHVGTLSAVMFYYRRDVRLMLSGAMSGAREKRLNEDLKLLLLVALATVPAVLAGVLAKTLIEQHLRSVLVIALTTIVFGIVLGLADRRVNPGRTLNAMSWRGAVLVGVAQALALIPGTSRSGITITAALLLGYSRVEAARFSFLLSMPVIFGAALLKTRDLLQQSEAVDWAMLALGASVSAVVAWLTIKLFIRFLDQLGMMPFVGYRLVLGTVLLLLFV